MKFTEVAQSGCPSDAFSVQPFTHAQNVYAMSVSYDRRRIAVDEDTLFRSLCFWLLVRTKLPQWGLKVSHFIS